MRKLTKLFLTFLLVLLAACSNNQNEDKAEGEKTVDGKDESVDVDKGLLNVEITIPASMFEGQDINTVIAEAKEDGIDEVTKNEDGSITYKMSKAEHREMMKEMGDSIEASIEDMKTGEDYASVKDITHNKSFTEFTLLVDREAYENSMDAFAVLGLGMTGAMYQLYNGEDPNDYHVTINVKDEATQEVFDTTVYPDDLEEEEAEQE